jgi:hypothetical protein
MIAAVKARDSDPEVKEGRFRNQGSSKKIVGTIISTADETCDCGRKITRSKRSDGRMHTLLQHSC